MRSDVLSFTLCCVVTFEIHILAQTLFEEETQRSFAGSFLSCTLAAIFFAVVIYKLKHVVMHIVFIEVRLVRKSCEKLLDVRLVSIEGTWTLLCEFRLPLSKFTRALILDLYLAYSILECYSRTYLPIESASKSGYWN